MADATDLLTMPNHHIDPRPIRNGRALGISVCDAAELAPALTEKRIVNVCEQPSTQRRDYWSSVYRPVGWVSDHGVMISLPEARSLHRDGQRSPLEGKLVIIGGSSLIWPPDFELAVESIFDQNRRR
jgi:hypothetical protein